MKYLPFAVIVAAIILMAAVLAVNAADSPSARSATETQAACLAEFFRFCGNVPLIEHEVRACIATHRASFSTHCLELAKGTK